MTECVVEVGMHPGPCWTDKNTGLVVCSRHKAQYEERAEEFGPFDWEPRAEVTVAPGRVTS